jgi:hypothetical protein
MKRRPVESQRQGQAERDKRRTMWCDSKLNDGTDTCQASKSCSAIELGSCWMRVEEFVNKVNVCYPRAKRV